MCGVGEESVVGSSIYAKKALLVTVPIHIEERRGAHDVVGDWVEKGMIGFSKGFNLGLREFGDGVDEVAIVVM